MRSLAVLWIVIAVSCLAAPLHAADQPSTLERRVKAAFIYKFAGYVDWPQIALGGSASPFVIGVSGDDEFGRDLERVTEGRTIGGRGIVVREIHETERPDSLQILFIAGAAARRLESLVAATGAAPCLIVTESRGALTRGSIINFVLENGHVRFEISKSTADRKGLVLSSQLLGVAKSVVTGAP